MRGQYIQANGSTKLRGADGIEIPTIILSYAGCANIMRLDEARDVYRELGVVLEYFARQRITNAQDTVDKIRSDNALRSDFV